MVRPDTGLDWKKSSSREILLLSTGSGYEWTGQSIKGKTKPWSLCGWQRLWNGRPAKDSSFLFLFVVFSTLPLPSIGILFRGSYDSPVPLLSSLPKPHHPGRPRPFRKEEEPLLEVSEGHNLHWRGYDDRREKWPVRSIVRECETSLHGDGNKEGIGWEDWRVSWNWQNEWKS